MPIRFLKYYLVSHSKLPFSFLTTIECNHVLYHTNRRTTFVIGKDGTIQHVFESFFNADHHVNSVLKVLKEEQAEPEVTVTEPTPTNEQEEEQ